MNAKPVLAMKLPPRLVNRIAYVTLFISGITFLLLKEWQNAVITLGLALAADPFDPAAAWAKRPVWQRSWLCVHLAGFYIIFVFTITGII